MNEIVLIEAPVLGVQAWRIDFPDDRGQTEVSTHQIDLDAALSDPVDDPTTLLVIWMPTGDTVAADLERRAERWVAEGPNDGVVVRANIRTNRVAWGDRRALVYAAPDQWPDALDAVVRFTVMARETATLERQMQTLWPALDRHKPLSHAVSFRQERLQAVVNQMTELVTGMRISYLHLQSLIEQTDPAMSSASKRLCAELVLHAGLHDRLDVMEEPIVFAMDHYELANTRLIEHKNASVEFFLTALIVIALILQTAVIFVQELSK